MQLTIVKEIFKLEYYIRILKNYLLGEVRHMKKKLLAILVCILVAICSAFTAVASTNVEKKISVFQDNTSNIGGNVLITETYTNRVIEVDSTGTIVWQKVGLNSPSDAERLPNGNTLISETNRVFEVNIAGTVVWEKAGLNLPIDVERLENGNTLITEFGNDRVIEINSTGTIVWQKSGLSWPTDAERLENGNTLILEYYFKNRVIEVNSGGSIVWTYNTGSWSFDVERLSNGNTLISELYPLSRVIEVNSGGSIVWQKSGIGPTDAEILENNNILIALAESVIEVNRGGTIVWEKAGFTEVWDAERIYDFIPFEPMIDGPSTGSAGAELCWTFSSDDPNDDQIKFIIEWGDGNSNETDYYPDNIPVEVCHTYEEDGDYTITATAEDETGLVSEESTFSVTIPRNRATIDSLFRLFLNKFPLLEVFLRAMNLLR